MGLLAPPDWLSLVEPLYHNRIHRIDIAYGLIRVSVNVWLNLPLEIVRRRHR